ncbi:MAG: glycosyl transferase, partial [Acidimicrobiales bacterium]|nr:glycosyl transferase [Acidimicrobiales bacterium]
LLVGAADALTRAIEDGKTKWLVAVGVLIGFGFLTKMLQAFVVVPGFAVTYLVAGPPRLRKRLGQLLIAGAAMFAGAGWWVAIVELVPASWRPYVGGSTNNSVLNLIFGYNGLGRVTGNETGSVGGGGGGTGMWGETGWLRMFNSEFGGQASWLIPAALILGGAGLAMTLRRHRTDRSRAALLLWGSWLVVTATVFSLSKGIIHPYYSVALAPAIGALVGIGGHMLWKQRSSLLARAMLAATVVASAAWTYVLLNRSPNWHPEVRVVVLVAAAIAAAALLAGPRFGRGVAILAVTASLVAGLAGPAAYALDTASTVHSGSLPSAGPTVVGGRGGPGGGLRGGVGGGGGGRGPGANGGFGGAAGGAPPTNGGFGGATGNAAAGNTTRGGGAGGLLNASTPSAALVSLLDEDASNYTWVLATIGANQASGYQLASDDPVMAIGGFNGTDPTPTLAAFQGYVSSGQIHYFVAGGTGGSSSEAGEIRIWVEANFTTVTVGSTTLYDLTQPAG